MNEHRFIGLDIETSGTDVNVHSLLQIGVYDSVSKDTFVADVRPPSDAVFHPEAMAVNGISQDRMQKAYLPGRIDEMLYEWLAVRGLIGNHVHVIGFNVGSFDMLFVRKTFLVVGAKLSYRTVDLNSILFALDQAGVGDFDSLKHEAKAYGARHVTGPVGARGWHDAGFDAVASYFAWVYLKNLILSEKAIQGESSAD